MQTPKEDHRVSRKQQPKTASPKSTIDSIIASIEDSDRDKRNVDIKTGFQYGIRTACPNVFISYTSFSSIDDDMFPHVPFEVWLYTTKGERFAKEFNYIGRFTRRLSVWTNNVMRNNYYSSKRAFQPNDKPDIKTVSLSDTNICFNDTNLASPKNISFVSKASAIALGHPSPPSMITL